VPLTGNVEVRGVFVSGERREGGWMGGREGGRERGREGGRKRW